MVAEREDDLMSYEHARRLVELLEAAYPHAPVRLAMVELYQLAFAGLTFEDARAAIVEHVQRAHTWPLVAELMDIVMRQRAWSPRSERLN